MASPDLIPVKPLGDFGAQQVPAASTDKDRTEKAVRYYEDYPLSAEEKASLQETVGEQPPATQQMDDGLSKTLGQGARLARMATMPMSVAFEEPKQAVAGLVGDVPGGGMMLPGMLGAFYEAMYEGAGADPITALKMLSMPLSMETFRALGKLPETFPTALEEGADKWLVDKGFNYIEGVNEALGIEFPKTTSGIIARIIGSAVPIPVPRLPPGAGALASTAYHTGNILAPSVMSGPGFTGRAAAQLGITGAIEQGIRSFSDNPEFPPMFSDTPLFSSADASELIPVDSYPEDVVQPQQQAFPEGTMQQVSDTTGRTLIPVRPLDSMGTTPIPLEESQLSPTPAIANPEFAKMNQRVEEEQHWETTKNIAYGVAALIGTVLALRYGKKLANEKGITAFNLGANKQVDPVSDALESITSAAEAEGPVAGFTQAKEVVKSTLKGVGGEMFDLNVHIGEHLRRVGLSAREIAQLVEQNVTDAVGMANEFFDSGVLGRGTALRGRSLVSMRREFNTWSDKDKAIFLDGSAAIREDMMRTRATAFNALEKDKHHQIVGLQKAFDTGNIDEIAAILEEQKVLVAKIRGTTKRVKSGMWKVVHKDTPKERRVFVQDPQLKRAMDRFYSNPRMVQVLEDLAKVNDIVLEEAVVREVADRAWADGVRNTFTREFTDPKTGETLRRVIYLPGKERMQQVIWHKRLREHMGVSPTVESSTAKTLGTVANWETQGLTHGTGIRALDDPFQATASYAGEVIRHVNQQVHQWNVLTRLTGLTQTKKGGFRIKEPKGPDIDTRTSTKYVGYSDMNDPKNVGGDVKINYHKDPLIKQRFGTAKTPNRTPQQLAALEDVIWVQRGSRYHGFYVRDKALKAALEYDPIVHNRWLKFGRFFNKLFTQFQTGIFSTFGITAFTYNNSLSTINAALRSKAGVAGTAKEAGLIFLDSYRGAWELFSYHMAKDYADLFTRAIAAGDASSFFDQRTLRLIRVALKRKTQNSLVGKYQRESGRSASATGMGTVSGQDEVTNLLDSTIPYVSKNLGITGLYQTARIWKHLNTALHEGTALGITLRKGQAAMDADKTANFSREVRRARKNAMDLVGDVQLRGTSSVAAFGSAYMPFFNPMLQGMATLGKSMYQAGFQRSIYTISAVIGVPTLLEVVYNNSQDIGRTWKDVNGTEWTKRDFFWKAMSAEQRNNNQVIMLPGRPPWEAILRPMVPETAFFRGLALDLAEIVFGLGATDHGIEHGNHFMAGLARIFDIALPPPLNALGSSMGIDLRAGLLPDESDGKGLTFLQGRQILTGGRAKTSDRVRYEGGEIEKATVAIMQDFFGSAATLAAGMYEGFNVGNEQTPFSSRVDFAFGELGHNLLKQTRWLQPLFGKALSLRPDHDISKELFQKKAVLRDARSRQQANLSGGTMQGDMPNYSTSIEVQKDPVAVMLSMQAPNVLSAISDSEKEVSRLRRNIKLVGNSSVHPETNEPIEGARQRADYIDAYYLKIAEQEAQQMVIMGNWERMFIESVNQSFGKDISGFKFDTFEAGPNPGDSVYPTTPSQHQTSE